MKNLNPKNLLVLIPILLLGIQFVRLGGWIVDDAAISFSYARSLAGGEGLILQPGGQQVEGFSNPLWVLLTAAMMAVRVFDPVVVPKLLGFAGVSLSMWLVFRKAFQAGIQSALILVVGLSLIAVSPGVVIWTASGLENGLLLLLAAASAMACISATTGKESNPGACFVAGALAGACALARPDGLVFAGAAMTCVLLNGWISATPPLFKTVVKRLGLTLLGVLAVCLPYLIFRIVYFGDTLPNTYYAKGGPGTEQVKRVLLGTPWVFEKLESLGCAVIGHNRGVLLFIGHIALVAVAISKGRSRPLLVTLLVFCVFAGLAYVLLPYDWMAEYRFASAWVFFFIASGFVALSEVFDRQSQRQAVLLASVVLVVGVAYASQSLARISKFAETPTISVTEVVERGDQFRDCGHLISVSRPSLLTADIGGIAYSNEVEVIDLGMLCDRRIARQLGEWRTDPDRKAFHDYILGERKPDFIATRAYHSWLADLDGDPRFRELYVPIFEYEDQWIGKRYGKKGYSGDYVRRDLITDETLSKMRQRSEDAPYPGCLKREPY